MPKKQATEQGGAANIEGKQSAPAALGQEFADLATKTLVAARLFLEFRDQRDGHQLWSDELASTLPAQLREPVVAFAAAETLASEARWHLKQAKDGTFYNDMIVLARRDREAATRALQAAHDEAETRLATATAAVNDTAVARAEATNAIIGQKLASLGGSFRALSQSYLVAFAQHELVLAGIDRAAAQVGVWSGTSNCEVLAKISRDLVRLIESDAKPGDYFASVALARRLHFDRDGWEKLEITVRKEAAALPAAPPNPLPLPPGKPRLFDEGDLNDVESRILARLRQAQGRPVQVKDLDVAAKLRSGSKNDGKKRERALNKLLEHGLVVRVRRGWWRAAATETDR